MRLFSWIKDPESFYKVANQRLNTVQIKYNSTGHKDWLWCRFYPIKISGKTHRSPKNTPKIIFLETYCSFISTACKYMQRSYNIYFWLFMMHISIHYLAGKGWFFLLDGKRIPWFVRSWLQLGQMTLLWIFSLGIHLSHMRKGSGGADTASMWRDMK